MAKLETEHIFRGGVADVFEGIRQYEKYPDYLPGVTKVKILEAKAPGSTCQVRYEINIIKKFFYVLNMFEDKPGRIWWNLDDSNLMKANDGEWTLTAKDKGRTKAKYALEVKFRGLVPSAITDKVAQANLPAMLTGFQKIIDETHASS